jgi:hypothetical protein
MTNDMHNYKSKVNLIIYVWQHIPFECYTNSHTISHVYARLVHGSKLKAHVDTSPMREAWKKKAPGAGAELPPSSIWPNLRPITSQKNPPDPKCRKDV